MSDDIAPHEHAVLDAMAAIKGDQTWICEICRNLLNLFSDYHGNNQLVHSRSWMKYDHDPVPLLVTEGVEVAKGLCDFCSRSKDLNWQLTGKRIRRLRPDDNTIQDLGDTFAACDDCDDFIRNGDLEDFAIWAASIHPQRKEFGGPAGTRKAIQNFIDIHREFLPSVHTRTRLTPLPPPAVLHPRQMPKIRDRLMKFWLAPDCYNRFRRSPNTQSLPGLAYGHEQHFKIPQPGPDIPEEALQAHARHITAGLGVAELFYVSRSFTLLATTAGQELKDLSITREELPATFGFMIWETPIFEVNRPGLHADHTAGIRAVSWTLVPAGVWFNFYIQPEDGDPNYQIDRETDGWLVPVNPGNGMPFGTHAPMPDVAAATPFRTLLATWFLMMQPGVGQEDVQPADKGLQRSYKRAGRPAPAVRVIDLRRRSQAEREAAAAAGESRKVSVRFLVRGHWKRQAYGPARSLRKTIYIAPFLKGPDDAPLKADVPVVKVLR